jgi:hypothetical protein
LFGDKILEGDGASKNHSMDHDDVFIEVHYTMEPHYVLVDPILPQ